MSKIISIIIPTYNMEKYLRKCLDSLVVSDENMNLLEVLIINDGSKDSSSQIAHEYESRFPCTFKVIDKENGNYGSCINRGLNYATGMYVKVLDADDYFDNKAFDRYINFLKKVDADMILTDYNIVNENGIVTKRCIIPYHQSQLLNVSEYCAEKNFVNIQMHAVTYRLSKLLENNYVQTTGVSYTDQEWIFMPITYMNTFCLYHEALYQYLVGRAGQTVDKAISSKQYKIRYDLIYKRIDYYKHAIDNNNLTDNKINYLKNRLFHSCFVMYRNCLIWDDCPEIMIVQFDSEIRSRSKQIYDEIAETPLCRYNNLEFIGYWRRNKKLPLRIKILNIIRQLVS